MIRVAAVVPVKQLEQAKMRLSVVLPPQARKKLALKMLSSVIKSVVQSSVASTIVVTADARVLAWARSRGLETVDEGRPSGPNSAAFRGMERATRNGMDASLVVATDLPLLTSQDVDGAIRLASGFKRCVVASSSHRGGTNLLLLQPPHVIRTAFGGNSFMKHKEEAQKAGVPFVEYRNERAMLDIDTPEDLSRAVNMGLGEEYSFVIPYLQRMRRLKDRGDGSG